MFISDTSQWEVVSKIPSKFSFATMLFYPWVLAWYLWGLVAWRIAAPMWMQLQQPLLCAVALAVADVYVQFPGISYADGKFARANEVVAFFPYYVVGVLARR